MCTPVNHHVDELINVLHVPKPQCPSLPNGGDPKAFLTPLLEMNRLLLPNCDLQTWSQKKNQHEARKDPTLSPIVGISLLHPLKGAAIFSLAYGQKA